MSPIITEIKSAITAAVEKLYPQVEVGVVIEPAPIVELGDLSSDIAVRLAEILRVDPDQILQRLIAVINSRFVSEWKAHEGFLCGRLVDSAEVWLNGDIAEQYSGGPVHILVAPYRTKVEPCGYLRIVARAILQSQLAFSMGLSPVFWVGGSRVNLEAKSWGRDAIAKAVEEIESGADHFESKVSATAQAVQESNRSPVTVWIYPDFLEKGRFNQFLDQSELRKATATEHRQIRCPERDELREFDRSFNLRTLLTLNDSELLSTVYVLAAPGVGAEVQIESGQFKERGNLPWYLNSIRHRLDTVFSASNAPIQVSLEAGRLSFRENERDILRMASFMRWHKGLAVLNGVIEGYLFELVRYLDGICCILNSPQFRERSQNGKLTALERTIIAGAKRTISDNIPSVW